MKGKSVIKLSAIIIVIALFVWLALFGLKVGVYEMSSIKDSLKLGLDLKGGVYVVLEASEANGKTDEQTMDKAIETIRGRVDQLGVAEPTIVAEGDNRIRVELPGVNEPEEAISIIGQTALLQFVSPDGDVLLTGADVEKAEAVYTTDSSGENIPQVSLEFTEEGTGKFAEATEKYYNKVISIQLDGKEISSPIVQAVITDGKSVITNIGTLEEAQNLAVLISAGALPVELKEVQTSTVGPTLGQDSLSRSLKAGILGIIIIFIFMALFYRLPGIIADIALVVYILLILVILSSIDAVLTLTGIAGLILSVGMAVDANVVIFERIKEEIRSGKSVRSSIDSGFKRAFKAIIDSNITTLIAAVSLYYFGSGSIRGFALTLGIGIVLSMLTAILFTKVLLKITADFTSNPVLFGVKGGKENEI